MNNEKNAEQLEALKMIEAVYRDKVAEINGREYHFSSAINHKRRVKVFAFYSKYARQIENGDMSFLDTREFDQVFSGICDVVLFDDMQLSKVSDHWDQHPEDFILFVTTAIMVISYPFLKGSLTS